MIKSKLKVFSRKINRSSKQIDFFNTPCRISCQLKKTESDHAMLLHNNKLSMPYRTVDPFILGHQYSICCMYLIWKYWKVIYSTQVYICQCLNVFMGLLIIAHMECLL